MSGTGWKATLGGVFKHQFTWGILAIVLLLGLNLSRDPSYLAITLSPETGNLVGNLIDILRAAAPVLMVSLAMVFVIATAGIDLSVGSVMAVAGATALVFLKNLENPGSPGAVAQAVLLALGIGMAVGLINGVLVSIVGLQPFISTLVMMLAGRGLAKVITGGDNTHVESGSYSWIANGTIAGFPVVFLLALLIVLVVALVVRRTALGMMIESIGINPRASRMAGIQPRGILLAVYALAGLLAAVAGLMATASVSTIDVSSTGQLVEMDAILAVVVGGTSLAGGKFSITGAVVGAFLIATLDKTVVFLGIPAPATPAFKAAVIIIICLLQSSRVRNLLRRRRARVTVAQPAAEPEKESVSA